MKGFAMQDAADALAEVTKGRAGHGGLREQVLQLQMCIEPVVGWVLRHLLWGWHELLLPLLLLPLLYLLRRGVGLTSSSTRLRWTLQQWCCCSSRPSRRCPCRPRWAGVTWQGLV